MRKEQQKIRYAKWQIWVEKHERSGLSQLEFCRQNKIAPTHFSYYRSRIKAESTPGENLFTPITIQKNTRVGEVQVILPNGLKCVLSHATDVTHIKQIVGALLLC